VCEVLLKHKAKIDAVDNHGYQPLHVACRKGHSETVKLMVSYGANVDAVDNYGLTPLHRAARGEKDCSEVCEVLLKHKAKIDAVDNHGYQPLHVACRKGHSETVKLMVSYGANINVVNNYRRTPLHESAGGDKDCPELCEILLKHKVKIDAVDEHGDQPLHLACRKGHSETVKLMVSYGANINVVNNYRRTPLHESAGGDKDCPELCEILLKHKTKIDAVDKDGYQPLHRACQKGHSETVKLMVSYGANVDAVDNYGLTPLHRAAGGEKDCLELCEILLRFY
jgi:serine/threonine-protein phosphatase 6 regulatory ankyrin repeat subunit A/serine/threonine-protein phosphatase 6 regulatory ankyrin repeat subunit B